MSFPLMVVTLWVVMQASKGKQVEEANKRGETKDNATNQERLAK